MLMIQPATGKRNAEHRGIGLALGGGGPLGGIYEVGALRALDDALTGVNLNRLKVYVGVSSGSFIAAGLAADLTMSQLCNIFINGAAVGGLYAPEVFLQPALSEYMGRASSLPELLVNSFTHLVKKPHGIGVVESFSELARALPTGIFDNKIIDEFLTRLFGKHGQSNDFRELRQQLYIVAVDLDTSEPVRFGAEGLDHVPISKAVQASSALPGLYPPVEIEGRYYVDGALRRTMHASVALDEGAELVLCINPLVPFDANLAERCGRPKRAKLIESGLPAILSQTFRTLIYSRTHIGLARYQHHDRYKNADIVLFEPNRDQSELFFANIFSYANRDKLCELAYQTTRRDLLSCRDELEPLLRRHGIGLRRDILEDETRTFSNGMETEELDTGLDMDDVTRKLQDTMNRLREWLQSSQ